MSAETAHSPRARRAVWAVLCLVLCSTSATVMSHRLLPPRVPLPPAPESAAALDVHGDPLPRGAVARLGSLRFRTGREGIALAVSPDGRQFATEFLDGRLGLFDLETGRRLDTFAGHATRIRIPGSPWTLRELTPDLPKGSAVPHMLDGCGRVWFTNDGGSLVSVGSMVLRTDLRYGRTSTYEPHPEPIPGLAPLFGGGRVLRLFDHRDGLGVEVLHTSLAGTLERFVLDVGKPAKPCCSPDGRLLAVIAHRPVDFSHIERRVCVVDTETGEIAFEYVADTGQVQDVALAPDGSLWLVENKRTLTHVARDGQVLAQFELERPVLDYCRLLISPDGRWIAVDQTPRRGHSIRVVRSSSLRFNFSGRARHPSPQLGALELHVLDAASGKKFAVVQRSDSAWPRNVGTRPVFVPGRDALLFRTRHGRCEVVDFFASPQAGSERANREHDARVHHINWSPDGQRLASLDEDGVLIVWDPQRSQAIWTRQLPRDHSFFSWPRIRVSADGSEVRVLKRTHDLLWSLRRFDVEDGTPIEGKPLLDEQDAAADDVMFARTRDHLVLRKVQSRPGEQRWEMLNVVTGERNASTSSEDTSMNARRAHHGRTAVMVEGRGAFFGGRLTWESRDDVAKVWKRELVFDPRAPDANRALLPFVGYDVELKLSPRGDVGLITTASRQALLFAVNDGRELTRLEGFLGELCSAAFSPDGRHLATGGSDGTILVWDVEELTSDR